MLGDEYPDWQSIRTQMLYGEPKNPALIDEYLDIRDTAIRNQLGSQEPNKFWEENQEALEDGLTAGWADRHSEDEVSAIQHAINLKARDEAAFLSEYQNQPLEDAGIGMLSIDELIQKQHSDQEGVVPDEATRLVAFADVQNDALYYTVMAFDDTFNGWVVTYGTTPEQKDRNLKYRDLRVKLTKLYPGETLEVRLRAALSELTDSLLTRSFQKSNGEVINISRMLVDANWGASRDIVYNWIRKSEFRNILVPSHGKYVGASTEPLNAGQVKQPGKRIGINWRTMISKEMPIRYALYDTNFWKSFSWERLNAMIGSSGCFTLFRQPAREHLAFATNLRSEYPVKTEGRGRTVDEWKLKPGEDNHYFDCLVGCCVAASMEGVAMRDQIDKTPKTRQRRTKEAKSL
jgi:phage terminase large subunit GpA-like protein